MTDRRDPERRLIRDAARYKRERDAARSRAERAQRQIVRMFVAGRLSRIEWFDQYIGMEQVLTPAGEVDVRQLEILIEDLLRRFPELAARAS